MPLVQTQGGSGPYHIEDFKEGCERSVKGALHFLPSSTKTITMDELKHIQQHHKGFAQSLRVLMEDESKSRVAQAKAKEPKPAPMPERASHRPTKVQRKAAGVEGKAAKKAVTGDTTKPSLEPMVMAAEERKLAPEEDKKDKKKGK